jgi:hypothetical protein
MVGLSGILRNALPATVVISYSGYEVRSLFHF